MAVDEATLADLTSPDRHRRKRAAERLASKPCADAVPLLIGLVADGHEDVRSSALVALARLPDPRGRDAALDVLARDGEDEFVQRKALFVLEALADDLSRQSLRETAAASPNSMLRHEAELILTRLDDMPPSSPAS